MRRGIPKLAIALEYDGEAAPRVTASGHDELAQAILRAARAAEVPIHSDRDLALVLDTLDTGDQIPPQLYVVIAEILCCAYRLSGKHKDFMDEIEMAADGNGTADAGESNS